MEKVKSIITDLIKVYYQDMGNTTGGNLHVAIDDGNLEDGTLHYCIKECEQKKDALGKLIGLVLLEFTEEERDAMYDDNHWRMSC